MPRNAHVGSDGGNLDDFRARRDRLMYRMHLANGKVVELTAEEREEALQRAEKLVREQIEERRQSMTEEAASRYILTIEENLRRPFL